MTTTRSIPDIAAEAHALLANKLKPAVPDVAPLVRAYYALPENGAGGSLHVVLDDRNIETHFVESALERAEASGDADGAALAKVLLRMSKTQRLKLCDLKWEKR
ncbi:hypothetical protein [Sorangium sp. So ce1024]|uniref:hypothetical protein n=1 Tax=Sorangium sp. So ce1024 TaxID=3133327 RepID=UPI003F0D2942